MSSLNPVSELSVSVLDERVTAVFVDADNKRLFETVPELLEFCKDVLYAWEEANGNADRLKKLVGYAVPYLRDTVRKVERAEA